jgi:hypothetical protein
MISGSAYADETHPQRPGFAYDAEIAVPGSFELQLGTFSANDMFSLPTTIRYSLDVTNYFIRDSEIAIGFDSLQRTGSYYKETDFSDYVNISFRKRFFEGRRFKFAAAPFATLSTGSGANTYGFSLIGTYERKLNVFVFNFAWKTRTASNDPADVIYWGYNQYDLMFRYGRILGKEGLLSRFIICGEVLQETPLETMNGASLTFVESIGYQLTESIMLDTYIQQARVTEWDRDLQYGMGITINSGYIN